MEKLYFNEKDKMVLDMTQYLFRMDIKKLFAELEFN